MILSKHLDHWALKSRSTRIGENKTNYIEDDFGYCQDYSHVLPIHLIGHKNKFRDNNNTCQRND